MCGKMKRMPKWGGKKVKEGEKKRKKKKGRKKKKEKIKGC